MNLFDRAKNILIKPVDEWPVIRNEPTTIQQLFTGYAVILAAIPAVAGFIGYSLVGTSVFGVTVRYPLVRGIIWAALNYGLSLAGVYVLALIVDQLAPSFGSQKNMTDSMKVVTYSYTAAWVGGIFHLVPALSPLGMLAGIYTLVLLWFGLDKIKAPAQDKKVPYFVVTLIVALVVFFLIGTLVTSIAFAGVGAGAITNINIPRM